MKGKLHLIRAYRKKSHALAYSCKAHKKQRDKLRIIYLSIYLFIYLSIYLSFLSILSI